MEFDFPLYKELKALERPEFSQEELSVILSKISQLDVAQAELVYAIMEAYTHETASRSKKPAKERFGGSWVLQNPNRGVNFKVKKIPSELKRLLANYVLYITGDKRLAGK